ncbi:hypothetical protein JW859_01370 [bacterium]|nr:hypothetical protein [bacterium]
MSGKARIILKSLVKSFLISLAITIPGLLLMLVSPVLGSVWLLLGSFWMMAVSYQRPWRLSVVSTILPPIALALSYFLQLLVFRDAPSTNIVGGVVIIGIIIGLIRGGVHQVYTDKGAIYARRTIGYLLIWLVCYGLTQLFAVAGSPDYGLGRITGAFSTAMLVTFTLVLLKKYIMTRQTLVTPGNGVTVGLVALVAAIGIWLNLAPVQADAQQMAQTVTQLISVDDLRQIAADIRVGELVANDAYASQYYQIIGEQRSGWDSQLKQNMSWQPITEIYVRLYRYDWPILPGLFDQAGMRSDRIPVTGLEGGSQFSYKPRKSLNLGQYSFLQEREWHQNVLLMRPSTRKFGATSVAYLDNWQITIDVLDGSTTATPSAHGDQRNFDDAATSQLSMQLLGTAYGRMRSGAVGTAVPPPDPEMAAAATFIASVVFILTGGVINAAGSLAGAPIGGPAGGPGGGRAPVPTGPGTQPAIPTAPAQRRQLPPLIYDGEPLATNDQGQYWDPVKGKWISELEARGIIKELNRQKAAAEADAQRRVAEQQSRADQDWEALKKHTRAEAEAERQRQIAQAKTDDDFWRRAGLAKNWLTEYSPEQLAELERLIEKATIQGSVTQADKDAMHDLLNDAFTALSGTEAAAAKAWLAEAAKQDAYLTGAMIGTEIVKVAATIALVSGPQSAILIPLAVGGSVGLVQGKMMGLEGSRWVEHVALSGAFNTIGFNAGAMRPGSWQWQAGVGGVTAGTQTAIWTRGDVGATAQSTIMGALISGGTHVVAQKFTTPTTAAASGDEIAEQATAALSRQRGSGVRPSADIDITPGTGGAETSGRPTLDLPEGAPPAPVETGGTASVETGGTAPPDGRIPGSQSDWSRPPSEYMPPPEPEPSFTRTPPPDSSGIELPDGYQPPPAVETAPAAPPSGPHVDSPSRPAPPTTGSEGPVPGAQSDWSQSPRDYMPQQQPARPPYIEGTEGASTPTGGTSTGDAVEFEPPVPPRNPYQGEGVDPNSGARVVDPRSVPAVHNEPQLQRMAGLQPSGGGEVFDIHGNQIGRLQPDGRLVDLHGREIRQVNLVQVGHGPADGRIASYIDADGNHIRFSEPRLGPHGEVIPGQLAVEQQTVGRSLLTDQARVQRTWEPRPDLDIPNRAARPPDATAAWDALGAGPQGQLTGRDGQLIGRIDSQNVLRTVDGEEILGIGLAREGRIPWYRTRDGVVWTGEGGPTAVDLARQQIGVGQDPELARRLIEQLGPEAPPTVIQPRPQ